LSEWKKGGAPMSWKAWTAGQSPRRTSGGEAICGRFACTVGGEAEAMIDTRILSVIAL